MKSSNSTNLNRIPSCMLSGAVAQGLGIDMGSIIAIQKHPKGQLRRIDQTDSSKLFN